MAGDDQASGRQGILYALLGVMAVALIGGGIYLLVRSRQLTPEDLVQQALTASSAKEQELACIKLAEIGKPATVHLEKIVRESKVPETKAAAMEGLGANRSWESMPLLLDVLEKDESPTARAKAAAIASYLLGRNYGYNSGDPPANLAQRVKIIRKDYEAMKKSPPPQYRKEGS